MGVEIAAVPLAENWLVVWSTTASPVAVAPRLSADEIASTPSLRMLIVLADRELSVSPTPFTKLTAPWLPAPDSTETLLPLLVSR